MITQVPLAADLAPPERKAGAISVVWAALMLGVLFGRVLSGIIAQFSSYRNVYFMAVGLQFATLGAAYFVIPNVPAKSTGLGYLGILRTMGKLAVTQPRLIQCALGVLVSSACFTNLWVTLDFLLSDAPFHYSAYVCSFFLRLLATDACAG
jgi:predicted MFS family arabinose efflux permease